MAKNTYSTSHTEIDIHDHVAEAYYGKLGEKFMKETQQRLHWIRDHVEGDTILDIGCSQGIGPILLGRLGKHVIGIDISQKAVDEAEAELTKEAPDIQEKIEFRKADFLTFETAKKFDTITITEVLEHLENPQEFIDKAYDLLKPEGRLIITVPFGINDHPDHKKTFYFLELYKMLYPKFDFVDTLIQNKWIGFIVQKKKKTKTAPLENLSIAQIEYIEKSFYSIERELLDKYNSQYAQLTIANEKYKNVTMQYSDLKEKMNKYQDEVTKLKNSLAKLQQKEECIKLKKSASYQLGDLLIHRTRSFTDILKLPIRIWRIRNTKKNTQDFYSKKKITKNTLKTPASSSNKKKFTSNKCLEDLNIACIMDAFTYESYAYEANFQQLTPENWKKEIINIKPDLLFVESAWRGKDELWWNAVGKKSDELIAIVKYCNQHDIPTVFWNKEDPVHFNTFINTATLFDFIFTTDIDMIEKYKEMLQHEQVYLLPFACQPKVNNPIEKYTRKDAFCFAGAYYSRYPERTKDLDEFIQYLPSFKPVEIYDRNYGKTDKDYMFPEQYKPYIIGTLPFDKIDKAYKGYNYAINLNSVKQSQSMFARRVYEVLASNTIVISNFSRAIKLLFGDLVITSDSGKHIIEKLKLLSNNEINLKKHKLLALRKVLSEHTYAQRFHFVIETVFQEKQKSFLPQVALVCQVKNKEDFDIALSIFNSQSYKNKSLYLMLENNSISTSLSKNDEVYIVSKKTSNKIDNTFKDIDYIAYISLENKYGDNYITDLALATLYHDGPIIGKASYYQYNNDQQSVQLVNDGNQYKFVKHIYPHRAIIKKTFFTSLSTKDLHLTLQQNIEQNNILSIDEFNYCENAYTISDNDSQIFLDIDTIDTGIPFESFLNKIHQVSMIPANKKVDPLTLSFPPLIGKERYLLLTNIYPSYHNLYRNVFVHARIKAYKRQGINVDVFQLQSNTSLTYYEFDDINVTIGSQEMLKNLLQHNHYESILVHFLDETMWNILKNFITQSKIIVWAHGFEIQPWYRRKYLYKTTRELKKAKKQSINKIHFWKKILTNPPKNLKLLFVSNYLAESVMEDLQLNIPKKNYEIIHNFIDTDLFEYIPKNTEQRKKILSIRPFANTNYANDLSVKAILELSKKPYFNELTFHIIGNGTLFDKTVEPLKKFNNIIIEKKFLTQTEIAEIHKHYGIFLCPSRMDTQGVSRDEAMSSGLVPITNSVAAIPEFVDDTCAILAKPEEFHELALGIEKLYNDPKLFQQMSKNAAKRVRLQSSFEKTIIKELKLFHSK